MNLNKGNEMYNNAKPVFVPLRGNMNRNVRYNAGRAVAYPVSVPLRGNMNRNLLNAQDTKAAYKFPSPYGDI